MFQKLFIEWLHANDCEMRRATTSYEQDRVQDFAIWLDNKEGQSYACCCAFPDEQPDKCPNCGGFVSLRE